MHILFGFDHLLFVLGLILIVSSTRMLLFTVTAVLLASIPRFLRKGVGIMGFLKNNPKQSSRAYPILAGCTLWLWIKAWAGLTSLARI